MVDFTWLFLDWRVSSRFLLLEIHHSRISLCKFKSTAVRNDIVLIFTSEMIISGGKIDESLVSLSSRSRWEVAWDGEKVKLDAEIIK